MTIQSLPYNTKLIDSVKFDVSIYPVAVVLTATGVQYGAEVTRQAITYDDFWSIDTHTYFPYLKGKLTWVYVNLSFEIKAGNGTPTATFQVQAKNNDYGTWVDMSAATAYTTVTTSYVAKKLEGYLLLTSGQIDYAPFSLKIRFKSSGETSGDKVYMQLKNDSVIKIVGSRETR